ncbi:DUF3696 domain-containing protein [Aliarcobacter butzleri]|uniref:DUF3696 domain-containing protein n=1 Tax=Aliarcobacter butzleri TaxID=28197 RepID=UPI003ADB8265
MISSISFENFKSFKSLKDLKLKPITIVCGTNSCGKSSILQSIMAMKQSVESQSNDQFMLLNGKYVHLGLFENIIYEKKQVNDVLLKFEANTVNYDLRFRLKRLAEIHGDDADLSNATISIETKLKSLRKQSKKILRPIRVVSYKIIIEYGSKKNSQEKYTSFISFEYDKSKKYIVDWKNIKAGFSTDDDIIITGNAKFTCYFNNLIPYVSIGANKSSINHDINDFFWVVRYILKGIFESYSYIGPLREEASRRYIYEDEVTEIGIKGENAPYLYTNESDNKIKKYYTLKNDKFMRKDSSLADGVNEWLNILGIAGFNSDLVNEMIYLNLDATQHNSTKVNIAEVGFGISQVFPIILEGLRIKSYDTLILEQPEIHLHPKMQMDIADYFLSLALSDKNLIIETHSEHLINRLVRRILEDETNKIKELIAIYFISPSENGAEVEPINIDPYKGIINWPKNFFDQTAVEQEKIIIAGLQKRKREREKKN